METARRPIPGIVNSRSSDKVDMTLSRLMPACRKAVMIQGGKPLLITRSDVVGVCSKSNLRRGISTPCWFSTRTELAGHGS